LEALKILFGNVGDGLCVVVSLGSHGHPILLDRWEGGEREREGGREGRRRQQERKIGRASARESNVFCLAVAKGAKGERSKGRRGAG
jgi:hypothetical protein